MFYKILCTNDLRFLEIFACLSFLLSLLLSFFLADLRPDIKRRKRKQEIKQSTIFKKQEDSKEKLARHLAGLAKANNRVSATMTSVFSDGSSPNVLIGRKGNSQKKNTEQKSIAPENKLNKKDIDTADNEMNSEKGGENVIGSKEEPTASANSAAEDTEVIRDTGESSEEFKTFNGQNKNSADIQGSLLVVYSSSNDSCTSEEDT